MTFPAYPEYRDSGVEWLGAVPTYWESWKISHAFGELGSGTTPPTSETEWYEGGTVPWVTTGELRESIIWETKKLLSPKAISAFSALRLHPAGSLAIAMYGATIGRLGILGVEATTNQACCLLTRPNHLHVKFTFYWLLVFKQSIIDLYASGGGQPNINQEIIANLKIPAPGVQEQIQIARFLDHETARIDALIEEQQRLIELLKEKRQALISQAVTKGLDFTVPMKYSGVEWLGKVPAHWSVTRSKFVFRLVSGYAFKSEFFQKNGDGEKVLITPGSFDELGRLYFSEKSTVQYDGEWQPQFELKVGDLVMVLTDLSYKKLILGRAAFVERDDALLNQRIAKVIITPKVKDNYLWLVINSEVMREQLKLTASGATVFHTSPERVGDCWIALPPDKEQLEITAFVEEFHFKLDKLIQQVRDTVDLLSERRSALISAAVTGKIDVRGWQQPASVPSHELEREAV
ncbi:restriction endonuclease subunit S [Pseudomonas sp. S1_F04]